MQEKLEQFLKEHHIRPNKRLGQHFLIDSEVLAKIVQTAQLTEEDTVLEIGPGSGVLTKALAQKAKKVIAVEKDRQLAAILKKDLANKKNVIVKQADILKMEDLEIENYKIVANLPYYITSPVIRHFLEHKQPPQEMTLLVQKEVAQRICAAPPKMSILAISVQLYCAPEIAGYVLAESFWPQPKVDSAILKLTNIKKPSLDTKKFFAVVKAGFSSPRKQLANNFSHGLALDKEQTIERLKKIHIDPTRRAQTLSLNEWQGICEEFK